MLTPPESYGCVEDGVYRCSAISGINFSFLAALGLGVIVSLNPDQPPKALRTFAHDHDIELVHIGIQPWRSSSDWRILGKDILQDGLTYILDRRNYPLLVMDAGGAFVGILRHIQHWAYSSIVAEYRCFSGSKAHYMTEIFLEMADIRCISHEEAVKRRKSIEQPIQRRPIALSSISTMSPPVQRQSRSQMVLHTPPDDVLPEWFTRQKHMWDVEITAGTAV